MKKKGPTHKECRHCGDWFKLGRYERPTRRFCSVRCAALARTSSPKWRAEHSAKIKKKVDPKVMRERAKALWRDPEVRARLTEQRRVRSNTKAHLQAFAEHNKKLWADKEFRKRHAERSSKVAAEQMKDPEHRKKLSAATAKANKERWADPVYKERVSFRIRMAKRQPIARKRQSEISREVAKRPEYKAMLRARMKKRWDDPEQRASMSARASETAKRKWRDDPAYRDKKLAALKKAAQSRATRERMTKMNKERWADPEYRAKQTEAARVQLIALNKKRWADPDYKARVAKKISKTKKGKKSDLHGPRPSA